MGTPAHELQQACIDRLCEQLGQVHDLPDRILEQFRRYPRHRFLSRLYLADEQTGCYSRQPLWVDAGCADPQTLDAIYADAALAVQVDQGVCLSSTTQPSLMAGMMVEAGVRPGAKVLEIGTATGWNAALLSGVVGPSGRVVTVEIDPDLAIAAKQRLAAEGCGQVEVVCADGCYGAPDHGPFDSILVTVACPHVAQAWLDQLAVGGTLVAPLALPDHSSPMVRLTNGPPTHGRFTGWTWFVSVRGEPWCDWPPAVSAQGVPWAAAAMRQEGQRTAWPWDDQRAMLPSNLGLYLTACRPPGFAVFEIPDRPARQRLRLGLGQDDPPGLAVIDGDAMLSYGDPAPARRLWNVVGAFADLGRPRLRDWRLSVGQGGGCQLGPPGAPSLGLDLER